MNFVSVLIILGLFSEAVSNSYYDKLVNTPSGPIRGTTSYVLATPVQTFLGIPFAKPPVGELRFKKPEPLEPWTKRLHANKMAPACIQNTTYPFPWYDFESGKSEDCLYLNIWAPIDSREGSKKAVIFWIYGGGPFGSNRQDLYNGKALAGLGDVILVSPNFRLGLFGFLTSGTKELPGNNGIWDLLLALQWVRKNIESFGGDPNQITIHGESSGSIIVSMLCVSPLTKGLFSKAIMESGSAIILQINPAHANEQVSQRIAKTVGCASDSNTIQNDTKSVLSCLREKDAFNLTNILISFNPASDSDILPQFGDELFPNPPYEDIRHEKDAFNLTNILLSFNPASDLDFLPQFGDELFPNPPYEDIRHGRFHHVPLLIGDNKDEGVNMVTLEPNVFGFFGQKDTLINKTYAASRIQETVDAFINCSSAAVISYYLGNIKNDNYYSIKQQTYTANGDITLTCPTSYFAESFAEGGVDVFYYLFTHRPSNTPWAPCLGTAHFEEVQFVFGLPMIDHLPYTLEEFNLSLKMVRTWTDFAKYGYPKSYPDWPKYSKKDHAVMIIDTNFNGTQFDSGPSSKNCNFLRQCFVF